MKKNLVFVVLAVFALFTGCAEKADRLTTSQRQRVMGWVSKSRTTPEHPLDIKFGDKVTLIGYDLSTPKAEVGKGLTITWHWQVNKKVGDGYRLFTHLADAADVSRVNLDMNGIVRQAYQPSLWEEGTYVRDPQTIIVPNNWESKQIQVYLGFWKGSERLEVTGPSDGNRRARALTLDVGVAEVVLPDVHAKLADKPLKIDGVLDEAVWADANATDAFVNTMNGQPAQPKTTVKTAYDTKNLYVAFNVDDDYLRSSFTQNDDHLWEQDCVEIMLDPDGDGANYFELQVSPANKRFDTRYDTRREPKPFGHMDFDSGLTSAVKLRGTLNDDEKDEGYTVEIAIPWKAFLAGEPKHQPAKAGDTWRVNFFLMDARDKGTRAVGWSPPRVGDFHTPGKFGKLVFDGVTTAAAPASGETTAAAAPAADAPKAN